MDSSKKKSVAMINSNSESDSDLSESEFKNLAKKPKLDTDQAKSLSASPKKSSSSSSSSSGSGDEWDGDGESPRKKKLSKKKGDKRSNSEVEEGEVSDSDSDIGEFDDGLDDELMGDEEDRKRLEEMNEKEREEEIFKRAEKREMLKKRYEIEKKLKLQKRRSKEEERVNKTLDTKERSRARRVDLDNKTKKTKKSTALDELKKKREEKMQKIEEVKKKEEVVGELDEAGQKKKWKTNDIYSSDSSDDDVDKKARMMEFPSGIETGDGGGFDMQLSNKVYNKIRNFSVKEGKRKNRVGDKEDKAVAEQAVDPQTRLLLYKLVNGGVLDSINGVISTGKEAVIMHADGGPGPERDSCEPMNVPKECAVKVFKTTLNEFKTRDKYIRDDYRFKDRFSKQNPRKVIHMWAEKELHNLAKMAKGGIRVPEIVVLKKHVLIMSFIGREGRPAPKLKDAADQMSAKDLDMAYQQVVEMMEQLYTVCHLVHADLSEYNILWYEKEVWFIDVSQAVEPIHPSGLDFLLRDCTNVCNFFSKRGVDCLEPHELFSKVAGLEVDGGTEAEIVCQIRNYQKSQAVQSDNSKGGLEDEDNFEYCWEHSKDKASTPSRPIPGHTKPKPAAKSPKSPKIPGIDCSRSPRTPGSDYSKSPKSPVSEIVGLTDDGLRKLKISLLSDSPDSGAEIIQPRKPSQIKFSDQSEFETVDPDDDGNV